MVDSRAKGYRVERKIRLMMEKHGWLVIRAGRSLGEADLICLKNRKCILLQIKSTTKNTFYYYGLKPRAIAGFPFYLVVDFGYGDIRMTTPKQIVRKTDGKNFVEFLKRTN
jgi:Holliday junction resolvase